MKIQKENTENRKIADNWVLHFERRPLTQQWVDYVGDRNMFKVHLDVSHCFMYTSSKVSHSHVVALECATHGSHFKQLCPESFI